MDIAQISVQSRTSSGKGAARKLRATDLAPGVVYGNGKEAVSISFSPNELRGIVRRSPQHRNTVIAMTVGEAAPQHVLIKDVQHHPLTRAILHVDFINIDLDKPVVAKVPVKLVGRAEGVKAGGKLQQLVRSVKLQCLPQNVPAQLEVDVSKLDRKETLRIEEVVAPEGASLSYKQNYGVAVIS